MNKKLQKSVLIVVFLAVILLAVPLSEAKIVTSDFTASEIIYSPSPAQPGQYVHLTAIVQNSMDEVTDAKFVLMPEYPFSFDPGEDGVTSFSRICKGCRRSLEYDLRVDEEAKEGTYEFQLRLCEDTFCNSYAEIPVQIYVNPGGEPNMRIVIEEMPKFQGGQTGIVTLNIINKGLLGVKYLISTLESSNDYKVLSPREVYIGSLISDDFDTVEYEIYMDKEVAGREAVLPVTLEYSDINDKEYTEQINVILPVYSSSEAWQMGLNSIGAGVYILLLIIAGLAYFGWKKREKIKEFLKKRKANA